MFIKVFAPFHAVWLCSALLACVPVSQPAKVKNDAGALLVTDQIKHEPVPVSDIAIILGNWDVASFEGYEPRRLSGTVRAAFADFGKNGVRLRIECNYSGRAGTVINGHFKTASDNMSSETEMGCGRERESRDTRYFSFFDKNPLIEKLGPNRLRLNAQGGELILERPAIRRLRFVPTSGEIQGRWRIMEVTRYMPQGGHTGIGLSEISGWLVISGDRIYYSKCPQYAVTFRLGTSGKLENVASADLRIAPKDCPELGEPASAPEMPMQFDAMRLIHANPAIEKADGNSILLSTDELGLLITKTP